MKPLRDGFLLALAPLGLNKFTNRNMRTKAFAFVLANTLIFLSFYLFLKMDTPVQWQVSSYDEGGFRLVAEKFWNIPHDFTTYDREYKEGTGHFYNAIPFRGIGVGSYFLAIQSLVHFFSAQAIQNMDQLGEIVVSSLRFFQFIAYLIFYLSCLRRYGARVALFCLGIILFPVNQWNMTDTMMSEPLMRIMFVLLLSLVTLSDLSRSALAKTGPLFMSLLILGAQIRVQWAGYSLFMLTPFILAFRRYRLPHSAMATLILLALTPALSVLWVNKSAWNDATLAPGTGLYVNIKSHGQFLDSVCKNPTPDIALLCSHVSDRNRWCGIYLGEDVSAESYRKLDTLSVPYLLKSPGTMARDFFEGLRNASNYADIGERYQPDFMRMVIRVLNLVTWSVLLFGITRRETRLLSSAGIGLWLFPAIGNVFAEYFVRYHFPMVRIPLVLAVLIAVDLFKSDGTTPQKT